MKILELFSGSRSIGKIAESQGYEVFSIDNQDFPGTNWVGDIRCFKKDLVPFVPDVIWASPPCTGFSVARIGQNWVKGEPFTPKTETARLGVELLNITLNIIWLYRSLNPRLKWFIENPRGKMRKSPNLQPGAGLFANDFIRHTISYCKYGDTRMKPTDIWTNHKEWIPRPMCSYYKYDAQGNVINQHCHHDPSPRGTQNGGTQKLKGNYERSKIPQQLCEEIIYSL